MLAEVAWSGVPSFRHLAGRGWARLRRCAASGVGARVPLPASSSRRLHAFRDAAMPSVGEACERVGQVGWPPGFMNEVEGYADAGCDGSPWMKQRRQSHGQREGGSSSLSVSVPGTLRRGCKFPVRSALCSKRPTFADACFLAAEGDRASTFGADVEVDRDWVWARALRCARGQKCSLKRVCERVRCDVDAAACGERADGGGGIGVVREHCVAPGGWDAAPVLRGEGVWVSEKWRLPSVGTEVHTR